METKSMRIEAEPWTIYVFASNGKKALDQVTQALKEEIRKKAIEA